MIKLFEQWLQEDLSDKFTIVSTTSEGELDVEAIKLPELSSKDVAAYEVISSRNQLANPGDTIMISTKDFEMGGKSDIVISSDINEPSLSKQVVGVVNVTRSETEV